MITGHSHENGQVKRIETINAQGSTIPHRWLLPLFFKRRLESPQVFQPHFSLPSLAPPRLTSPLLLPTINSRLADVVSDMPCSTDLKCCDTTFV